MFRTRILLAITGLLLCWAPLALAASDDEAKTYFLEGKKSYAAGQYQAAIAAFQAAAKIRPSPILDFNIGRCHHNLGQIAEAIASYRRYLEAAKDGSNRDQVLTWIKELEQKSSEVKDPYEEAEKVARPSSQPSSGASVARTRPVQAPTHEALLPQSWSEPAPTRKNASPARKDQTPVPPATRSTEGPLYKQWWFWAGCAGAAVIAAFIIYTAASSGSSSSPVPRTTTQGLILHF